MRLTDVTLVTLKYDRADPSRELPVSTLVLRRVFRQTGFVRFRRKQKLDPEITDERILIAARRFEAASCHEEKNHRAVNFIAATEVDCGLVFGRMEGALVVELHVAFKLGCEIVSDHEPGEPAVWSFVNALIADLVVHVDRAKFL